jgi:hypothetical protein
MLGTFDHYDAGRAIMTLAGPKRKGGKGPPTILREEKGATHQRKREKGATHNSQRGERGHPPEEKGGERGHPQFSLATGQTTPCLVRLTIMTLAGSTSDRAKASPADR